MGGQKGGAQAPTIEVVPLNPTKWYRRLFGALRMVAMPLPPARAMHGDALAGEARAPRMSADDKSGRPLCDECGICVHLCPSHALALQHEASTKGEPIRRHLHLNLLSCVGCGACIEACPPDALSPRPRAQARPFTNRSAAIVDLHAELARASRDDEESGA